MLNLSPFQQTSYIVVIRSGRILPFEPANRIRLGWGPAEQSLNLPLFHSSRQVLNPLNNLNLLNLQVSLVKTLAPLILKRHKSGIKRLNLKRFNIKVTFLPLQQTGSKPSKQSKPSKPISVLSENLSAL